MLTEDATIGDWARLIRAEYLEMPGLTLTKQQMERMWSLDPLRCEAMLSAFVDTKFLRRLGTGAYVRADLG
jgi:hypothetical protein